jgi:hypothetical protein
MKSKYKSTKIHNKQSGNSPKSCTYYDELDEIFGNSPAIISDATCSNLQGIVLEKKRKQTQPQLMMWTLLQHPCYMALVKVTCN